MFTFLRKTLLTALLATFASQASAMWIQADWFDPTMEGVGTNRYAYSFNDPVNRFDPGGNQSLGRELSGMDQEEWDRVHEDNAKLHDSRAQELLDLGYPEDDMLVSEQRRLAEEQRARIGLTTGDLLVEDTVTVVAPVAIGKLFGSIFSRAIPKGVPDSATAGSIRGVNPTGSGTNCVNCVIATDATLSGRATSAMPSGPQPVIVLSDLFGGTFRQVSGQAGATAMLEAAGPGARMVVFGSRSTGVGHVFNGVNQGGTVRFLGSGPIDLALAA